MEQIHIRRLRPLAKRLSKVAERILDYLEEQGVST